VLTFSQCILDRAIAEVSGSRGFTWDSEGEEHLPRDAGAILVSAHAGNYEVGGAFLHLGGFRLSVVMMDYEAEAIRAVHRRFGSDRNVPTIIAINKNEFPALAVLSALRRREVVALHGDRIIDEHWVLCDFFGRKARFPTGVFMMAAAARVPVVLTFGFKEGPSHYRFVAEPPRRIELPREGRAEALASHAQWYATRLEAYARRYPYQWFNFFDFWETSATAPKS
jgi:predicted LPLAT superfamily acyltransferase